VNLEGNFDTKKCRNIGPLSCKTVSFKYYENAARIYKSLPKDQQKYFLKVSCFIRDLDEESEYVERVV
jgi:hypothetical protein